MSPQAKKRIVAAGLVLFALWPAVHHALVVRYGINPWKLFGWSMYCVPVSYVQVRAFRVGPDGEMPIDYDRDAALQAHVIQFIHDRWVWGTVLPPDVLARSFFANSAEVISLRLAVDHLGLDRESAYYRVQRFEYAYSR